MAITEITDSGWIDDVNFQKDGEQEVSTGTSIFIKFSRTPAASTLINEHFKIYDTEAEAYLDSPWMEVLIERDYSFINRGLTLYLELPLETSHTYRFIMSGLEDGAGNSQIIDHVIEFDTSSTPSPVEFRLDDEPAFIEDLSVIEPDDTLSADVGSVTFYVVETSPPDGTVQVALETSTITATLSLDVEADPSSGVTVEKRYIDNLWHPWVTVTPSSIDVSNETITITLTAAATPDETGAYLDYNYEYKVTLAATLASADATPVALGAAHSFTFYAILQPFFYDPYDLAEKFPDLSMMEIAEIIYRASLEAARFASGLELDPENMGDLPHAAQEYVRCRSLFLVATTREEAITRMELADLIIVSDSSWTDDLKECIDRWQYVLENYGTSGIKPFTKSHGLIGMPEQGAEEDYPGTAVRPRNQWWGSSGST